MYPMLTPWPFLIEPHILKIPYGNPGQLLRWMVEGEGGGGNTIKFNFVHVTKLKCSPFYLPQGQQEDNLRLHAERLHNIGVSH